MDECVPQYQPENTSKGLSKHQTDSLKQRIEGNENGKDYGHFKLGI